MKKTIANIDTNMLADEVGEFLLSAGNRLEKLQSDLGPSFTSDSVVEALKLGAADVKKALLDGIDALDETAIAGLEGTTLDTIERLPQFAI